MFPEFSKSYFLSLSTVLTLTRCVSSIYCSPMHNYYMQLVTIFRWLCDELHPLAQEYLEPCKNRWWVFFAKIVQSFYSLIIFTKKFIIDVWKDFKYVSDHEKLQLIMVVTLTNLHCRKYSWKAVIYLISMFPFLN